MPDFETDGVEHLNDQKGKGTPAKRPQDQALSIGVLIISHAQLLWFACSGGLHYIDLLVIFGTETVVVNQLASLLYPTNRSPFGTNSAGRFICMLIFIALLMLEYSVFLNGRNRAESLLSQFSLHDLLIGIVYTAIRIIGAFWVAKKSANPKLSWARTAVTVEGMAFLTLIIMLTFGFFAAGGLVDLMHHARPELSPGVTLSVLIIVIHFCCSLWASTRTDGDILRLTADPS
jgi:hypothetical protein